MLPHGVQTANTETIPACEIPLLIKSPCLYCTWSTPLHRSV